MLGGCFLVTHATHADRHAATPIASLVGIIALLHAFVALSIPIAAWHARRGLRRDAAILLAVPALLMGDAGFVQAELLVQRPDAGLWVVAASFAFTLAELWCVGRAFGVRWSGVTWAAMAGSVALSLTALGTAAAVVQGQQLTAAVPFALVCAAAIVAALTDLARRADVHAPDPSAGAFASRLGRWLPEALALLMLLHVAAVFVVFATVTSTQHAAPLALAGAVLLAAGATTPGRALAWAWTLGLAAVLLSLPIVLTGNAARGETGLDAVWVGVQWTPLRGTLVSLTLLGLWLVARRNAGVGGATSAALAGALALLGADTQTMADRLGLVVPNTPLGWGTAAITAAFACLALGTWSTWRRAPDLELDLAYDPAPPAPPTPPEPRPHHERTADPRG